MIIGKSILYLSQSIYLKLRSLNTARTRVKIYLNKKEVIVSHFYLNSNPKHYSMAATIVFFFLLKLLLKDKSGRLLTGLVRFPLIEKIILFNPIKFSLRSFEPLWLELHFVFQAGIASKDPCSTLATSRIDNSSLFNRKQSSTIENNVRQFQSRN